MLTPSGAATRSSRATLFTELSRFNSFHLSSSARSDLVDLRLANLHDCERVDAQSFSDDQATFALAEIGSRLRGP